MSKDKTKFHSYGNQFSIFGTTSIISLSQQHDLTWCKTEQFWQFPTVASAAIATVLDWLSPGIMVKVILFHYKVPFHTQNLSVILLSNKYTDGIKTTFSRLPRLSKTHVRTPEEEIRDVPVINNVIISALSYIIGIQLMEYLLILKFKTCMVRSFF